MLDQFTSRWQTITTFFETQSFPTNDWARLGSWSYWTGGPLDSQTPYYAFGLAVFLISLIALEVWRRRLKKAHQATPVYTVPLVQISNVFYFLLLMVPSYWFFRIQSISYLSSRLVLGAAFIIALAWVIWIIIVVKRRLPQEQVSYLEKERFFRYLPTTSASDQSGRKKGKNK